MKRIPIGTGGYLGSKGTWCSSVKKWGSIVYARLEKGVQVYESFKEMASEYSRSFDANLLFLDAVLLSGVRMKTRKEISFFSPRRWRKELKPLQVAAFKNLKLQPQESSVQLIAREIAETALMLTNGKPYDFVCNVPGGSSRLVWNFAALIARSVAKELDVPYGAGLEGRTTARSRSSHPKQSDCFHPLYREGILHGDFGLLVDDVATSGVHFEKSVALLKKHGKSVVCISWIT
jgi:hypothetical protein